MGIVYMCTHENQIKWSCGYKVTVDSTNNVQYITKPMSVHDKSKHALCIHSYEMNLEVE